MRHRDLSHIIYIQLVRLELEHYEQIWTVEGNRLWDSRDNPGERVEDAFRRFLSEGYRAARRRVTTTTNEFELYFGDGSSADKASPFYYP